MAQEVVVKPDAGHVNAEGDADALKEREGVRVGEAVALGEDVGEGQLGALHVTFVAALSTASCEKEVRGIDGQFQISLAHVVDELSHLHCPARQPPPLLAPTCQHSFEFGSASSMSHVF
jgi:hypothetical protein